MKFEKIIASFMAAITTLMTLALPVLSASNLGGYPGFLVNADGTPNYYFVVGSKADPADIVAAIDIASRLGQSSVTSASTGTLGAGINGIEKNDIDVNYGNLTDKFPNPIRSFHYSGMKQGQISWRSNNYDYHEDLQLGNVYFSHDFGTSGINGTETMVVQTNQVKYEYVFDKALNFTDLATTAKNTGTTTSLEYTNPIKITMLGKDFLIVGLGSGQVIMLSGTVGTADATTPVQYGNYYAYSTQGSNGSWAKVIIKDAAGNTVDTLIVNQGDTKTSTVANVDVRVTSVRALQDGTVIGTDVVVGPVGSTQKTYTTACDITSTGTSDTKFSGETEWCLQVAPSPNNFASSSANVGYVAVGDKLQVVYKPTTTQYIKMTAASPKLALPNNYGEIGFEGWNYNSFATLTFSPVTGQSGYTMIGSGATNSTVLASNLNGILIESDVVGTIVDPNTNTGYSKAYVLFNYTNASGGFPVLIGFWDSVNGRIGVNTTGPLYYRVLEDAASATAFAFNFTISYGGGASTADQQTLWFNMSARDVASPISGGSGGSVIRDLRLITPTNVEGVRLGYTNKTASWTTSSVPEWRLYSTDSAEAKDVQALQTSASGGTPTYSDIGMATQDVVTNGGNIVLTANSYSGSQIAKIKVPAQALKVKAYIGKLASGTTGGTTTVTVVPITSAVAKLDTEVTATEKAKDLVVVGGPCVNKLAADVMGVTFPACGTASGIPENAALIKVVDNLYTNGTQVVLVAGWEAVNTRTAASVLQQYSTLLTGSTATAVKVTAATTTGITAM